MLGIELLGRDESVRPDSLQVHLMTVYADNLTFLPLDQ